MRNLIAAFVMACLLCVPLHAQQPAPHQPAAHQATLRSQLEARLKQIADRLDGVMGYFIVDLTSGERFGLREQETFPTASTIKLAILYELFKQVDAGKIKLDVPEALPAAARAGGSGLVGELTSPHLSLRDHAILMILISDNTSTNVLIDRLGMQAIQARIDALGFTRTKLRRRMMDTDAARRGDENVSSPAEVTRLLELFLAKRSSTASPSQFAAPASPARAEFHKGEGLTPASRDAALDILTKSKSTAFTRTLPPGLRIASKPGGLDGVQVDAGYVMLKGRPYIAAFMTTYLSKDAEGGEAIGEASRAVFDYFDRLGAEGSYGRRIR
jgi:beta-lactamase class A